MKIHLLWKKEEIDETQMGEEKIAVVFDVLLATSTITACLSYGAKEIIPVFDRTEALEEANKFSFEDICLVGESGGLTIEGFLNPAPVALKKKVKNKTVILSTTNGTVAIRKASTAKKVYIASLLNGDFICRRIMDFYANETIIVVCAGSKNNFCIEDFYGAGYLINQLVQEFGDVEMTDSALAAKMFYSNLADKAVEILSDSSVGRMLIGQGFQKDVQFVSGQGILSVVPRVNGNVITVESMVTK